MRTGGRGRDTDEVCGRYTLTTQRALAQELAALAAPTGADAAQWWRPRFNIAPTQLAPVLVQREGQRALALFRWGLVPAWSGRSPRPAAAPLLINARAETLLDKPMFRRLVRRRRCLVLADGFFEWVVGEGGKQPIWISPWPVRPIAFAGLWDEVRMPDGSSRSSFAIVTGPPDALVAPIHDRMPIVLPPERHAAYLAEELDDASAMALLAPIELAGWRARPVARWANDPRHDDERCIEDVSPP